MPYTPTTWVEGVTTLGPTNMNHIEQGIAAAPGTELAYVQFTADVAISATSAASANTIVTATAVTFDGSTAVWIEFQATRVEVGSTALAPVFIDLWDSSTNLGILGSVVSNAPTMAAPFNRSFRMIPSSGSHTFSVRGWISAASPGSIVRASTGGAATNLPGHIRITRV